MSAQYDSAIEYANSLADDELFSSADNPTTLNLKLTHGELRYIQGLAKEKGMSIKRYMEWEIGKRYYEFHMDKGRVSPPMTPTPCSESTRHNPRQRGMCEDCFAWKIRDQILLAQAIGWTNLQIEWRDHHHNANDYHFQLVGMNPEGCIEDVPDNTELLTITLIN